MKIDQLIEGYQAFRQGRYLKDRPLYDTLVEEGQSPEVMMVSCCDSRVDPVMITGAAPGALFSVRNVANLIPPYNPDGEYHGTSAALEFAVKHLRVKDIIVMGHALCGGIKALRQGKFGKEGGMDFIHPWMSIAQSSCDKICDNNPDATPDIIQRKLEEEVIRLSLENMRSFDYVKSLEEQGKLTLHGWYFELSTGKILALNTNNNAFEALE